MIPVEKNVILASSDQVAVDAVAAKLMGFDPLSIKYIRLAHDRGLGVGDPQDIEILGDDISGENWGFKVGSNFHGFLAWLAWYGPTKSLQKFIMHTPIVNIPIFMSELNHDIVAWPTKYRGIYEDWRVNTSWGHLFDRYMREGYLAGK
jgi:hypothetical protein